MLHATDATHASRRFRHVASLLAAAALTTGASADPLLEMHDDTLTAYKPTLATSGQDVFPTASERATRIDGTRRAGAFLRWSTAANPFGEPASGRGVMKGGIDLHRGALVVQEVDIALPAELSWAMGRTYNARQHDGLAYHDSDGPMGMNWFNGAQPEIILHDDPVSAADDVLYIVFGSDRFLEFRRVNASSDEFRGVNGAAGLITFIAGTGSEPDVYEYVDQRTTKTYFFGFDADASPAAGQIWKIVNAAGDTAYVGHETTASTAISDGYTSNGLIEYVYDAKPGVGQRRYAFTYTTVGGQDRIESVDVAVAGSGSWPSPTTIQIEGSVDYTYYGASETYGSEGDLKTVTRSYGLTERPSRTKYYRYYKGTYSATTNPGEPHLIQYIYDFEGVRKFDIDADGALNGDYLTASELAIRPYASAYFEYDSERRIRNSWFNGECGCSGASNGEYTFTYEDNGSFSDTAGYDAGWKSRTIVGRPDGSYLTQYFDEVGQALSSVISDGDPAGTSPTPGTWVSEVIRDASGRVSETRTPAANASYTHSSGAMTANAATGLIRVYDRVSTGDLTGLVEHVRSKVGTGGTAYYDRSVELDSVALAGADGEVRRAYTDSAWSYTEQTTTAAPGAGSPPAGAYETTTSRTFWSGSLLPKEVTVTQPAVSAGNNGSNTTTTTHRYLREDGTTAFTRDAGGHFSYTERAGGRVVKQIRDAVTNSTTDFAAGDDPNTVWGITETGDGLARVSSSNYLGDGTLDTTTSPSTNTGEESMVYHSALADGRQVMIRVPRKTTSAPVTFYGPLSYTVSNHMGKAEFSATVSLPAAGITTSSGFWIDETDDDPITALDIGTIETMSVSIYNESGGTLEESWSYFAIPASGLGTDGTHYDATKYSYDDMGRRVRVVDATGTISRTVHDDVGRPIERWTGTNDSSFAGSPLSGTDNMVKVSETVYDAGAAGGNNLVTTRRSFIQDSATGQRESEVLYDGRGRAIVSIGESAPFSVTKLDHAGRAIARGVYSLSTGLTASTDPTSVATNRIGLSETFYDERGRVWKTVRHEVNQSTGALGDSLVSLTWYDDEGRVVKTENSRGLRKTLYDRLGRVTHSFQLAKTNDAAYADAEGVSGDHVLEESQTHYDDQGRVVMSVAIQRAHDDRNAGTTGPLDTNADADDLLLTPANINGRASIACYWYDDYGRRVTTAAYGDYGGASFDRDGLAEPTVSSSSVLVTSVAYDDAGRMESAFDAKGLETRYEYDALGRRSKTIANYVDGTPGGGTLDDEDQTILYGYTDGLQTTITADLPAPQADQVTTYTYGVDKGVAAGDSLVASGSMLLEVEYPDSTSASDVVSYAYNASGQQVWMKDQAGNIIETAYDDSGRRTTVTVSTLASGFDGAVRRIEYGYTDRGQIETVTQYDATTGGSVVDEVKHVYTDWGQLSAYQQDRDSAVSGGGNHYEVSYTYAMAHSVSGVTNGYRSQRRTGMTNPDGETFTYDYITALGFLDGHFDRVRRVKHGSSVVALYSYLGSSRVVGIDLPVPDVYSQAYDGSGDYTKLDRFGRVTTNHWTRDLATDVDWYAVDLAFDENSNITSIEDTVFTGFDAIFTMDDLDRLRDADEGTLSGSSITNRTRREQWTLDQVGNWNVRELDLNGDGDLLDTDELDELNPVSGAGSHFNAANEWLARDTDGDGTDDMTLSYDAVGNLTDDGEHYDYEYDAFGRLRKVKNRSTSALVAEYRYNGLGHRIGWHIDEDADGTVESNGDDPWHYVAFDERWRELAVYEGSATESEEWIAYHAAGLGGYGGSSYIDGVLMRSQKDGASRVETYPVQNWRGDVVALLDDSGRPIENVRYSSYGVPFSWHRADVTSDGTNDVPDGAVDSDDFDRFYDLWVASDARADVTTDGTSNGLPDNSVTLSDYTHYLNMHPEGSSRTHGRGVLSASGNRIGYAGYKHMGELAGSKYLVRFRAYDAERGKWTRRDPIGYGSDGLNLYGYSSGSPISRIDFSGLLSLLPPTGQFFPGGDTRPWSCRDGDGGIAEQLVSGRLVGGTCFGGGGPPPENPDLPDPTPYGCAYGLTPNSIFEDEIDSLGLPRTSVCDAQCAPGNSWGNVDCVDSNGNPLPPLTPGIGQCCICLDVMLNKPPVGRPGSSGSGSWGTDVNAFLLVSRCVMAHESTHVKQCGENGESPNINCQESAAYFNEMACLRRALRRCPSESCREVVQNALDDAAFLRQQHVALCPNNTYPPHNEFPNELPWWLL